MGRAHRMLGMGLVGLLLLVILTGFFWLPYDPLAIDLDHTLAPPSFAHWLGTDEFGRDVASRAMLGARISAFIGVETVAIAIVAGTFLGLVAGFLRGWTERAVMTVSDALLAFPGILLALALIAVIGQGQRSIVIALAIAYLPSVIRVVRGATLSIREREYIVTVASAPRIRVWRRDVGLLGTVRSLGSGRRDWSRDTRRFDVCVAQCKVGFDCQSCARPSAPRTVA